MTSVRSAKSKGSQFEYDCQYSLSKIYFDIYRTAERGFQRQYDLQSDHFEVIFECKRLKSISWNQLCKFYCKLKDICSIRVPYLLFKSNFQPCLVFYQDKKSFVIRAFKDVFGVPFEKHPSTRVKK